MSDPSSPSASALPNPIQRPDGRGLAELRNVQFVKGFTPYAEGSVLVRMGHTHVLCNASVLDQVPPFLRGRGQGWITAEYGMLPRATHTRSDREAVRGRQSGRTQEIQRLIGRSIRAAFNLPLLGERSVQLDCDVLQADGGTRCAAITGAWVAAAIAVHRLVHEGQVPADVLREPVAAVSVGLLGGQPVLDLNYEEDSSCDADMNLVMTASGALVEVQATAEKQAFERSRFDQALDLARDGISQLVRLQQQALRE